MRAGSRRSPGPIALYYADDAYVEMHAVPGDAAASSRGLMGRRVAGHGFLTAYLDHGNWTDLVALAADTRSAATLRTIWESRPSTRSGERTLEIVDEKTFFGTFGGDPPARLLHLPVPLDARFAWAREDLRASFALSGVTHTLATKRVLESLRELVTAPFESYDALVCTSRAAIDTVRAVTDGFIAYLHDRHGMKRSSLPRLELIPLGVDTERFRPASNEERRAARRMLEIPEDALLVLFVGRLSFHAKAHPLPMFKGVANAAAASDVPIHLVLAGWAANQHILEVFKQGAETFARDVRVSFVDGTGPMRFDVWHAADVFASLSDNIQETFGLAVIEAMSRGLPVVVSDWDGYRDLVVDGETGFLVPTYIVDRATAGITARLLFGELSYDEYLARCVQAVTVDLRAATAAFERVLIDAELRRRMGDAGRRRAEETYAWPRIIGAYEDLWASQEDERRALGKKRRRPGRRLRTPSSAVDPFATYPTAILDTNTTVWSGDLAPEAVDVLLASPLTNFAPAGRCVEPDVIQSVIALAADRPRLMADIDRHLGEIPVDFETGRATLAWMLKYGLLEADGSAR